MYWANIPYFGGVISRCVTCSGHCPLPQVGTFNCLNWLGAGGKGGGLSGGMGSKGGGKGEV